jgi:protein-tyrosine phosphatase
LIDLHAHILPALDDGARDLDEALAMAQVAVRDGITVMAATVHGVERGPGLRRAECAERIAQFQAELDERGIPLRIALGVETWLSPDLPEQIRAEQAFGLGGQRYLLIELPTHQFPLYTEQIFFEVQLAGLQPIIAHPERNTAIQNNLDLLARLVEKGALGQVTVASLVGSFGPRARAAAEAMLRRNLVHFIATDTHGPEGHRAPLLSAGREAAARLVGTARATAMVEEIPAAILAGETVQVPEPVTADRKPFWKFWG